MIVFGMFRWVCDIIEKWDNNLFLIGVVKFMIFVGFKILFLNVFFFKEMCIELLISGNEFLICRWLEDIDEDVRF